MAISWEHGSGRGLMGLLIHLTNLTRSRSYMSDFAAVYRTGLTTGHQESVLIRRTATVALTGRACLTGGILHCFDDTLFLVRAQCFPRGDGDQNVGRAVCRVSTRHVGTGLGERQADLGLEVECWLGQRVVSVLLSDVSVEVEVEGMEGRRHSQNFRSKCRRKSA